MTNTGIISKLPEPSNFGVYNPCEGALSIILPEESRNLIINPSFEITRVGFQPSSNHYWFLIVNNDFINPAIPAVGRAGVRAWSGASSLDFRQTNNNPLQPVTHLIYRTVAVEALSYYACSFYINGATGQTGRSYRLQIVNFSTGTVLAEKPFKLIEDVWQRIELVHYFSSAVTVELRIAKNPIGISYANGDCFIDAVQFEKITPISKITNSNIGFGATTYFDGDTRGSFNFRESIVEYAWLGAPMYSESVRMNTTATGGRIVNLQNEMNLQIIGIFEAGMAQPENLLDKFNTADGASLHDIINGPRKITLLGMISGSNTDDFARKMSALTGLFGRDVNVMRQPRTYVFQHKSDRDDIGVPMTFSALFESGMNVNMTNQLTATVDITLNLLNPYFYGHDENAVVSTQPTRISNRFFQTMPSRQDELFNPSFATNNIMQLVGELRTDSLNAYVTCMAIDRNGRIWIGGAFTASTLGQTLNRIAIYDPRTKTFSPVLSGAVNGLNGVPYSIKIAPNGDVWVGGLFTLAGGVAGTAYIAYYRTNTFVAFGGALNGLVGTIAINPITRGVTGAGYLYEVVIGGAFTLSGALNRYRIARTSNTASAWDGIGTASGFDNTVNQVVFSVQKNRYYVGGLFTYTQGAGLFCQGIAQINPATNVTSTLGGCTVNGEVYGLFLDQDDVLGIGSIATTLFNPNATALTYGACIFRNNVVLPWNNGYLPIDTGVVLWRGGFVSGQAQKTFQNNGAAIGCLAFWNGTLSGGNTWLPIGNAEISNSYHVAATNDGTLYMSPTVGGNAITKSPIIARAINTGTASAKPRVVIQTTTADASPVWIANHTNRKAIAIDNLAAALTGINSYDRVFIDTDDALVQSAALGNISVIIAAGSNFYDFTIEPGQVLLSATFINESEVLPTNEVGIYWKQTFQSIFDGVAKK